MLEALKKEVYEANMALPAYGLVVFTWGNVSAYDPDSGLLAIKPSGVQYKDLKEADIVLVNLDGLVVEGDYKPSSDTMTHIEIYKAFPNVRGIVHTHSPWATSFAQAGLAIDPFGTTHGDYFYGPVPCTRKMNKAELENAYEVNTGKVIVETFDELNPDHIPAVLVNEHGPFTWGDSAEDAVYHAVVLEEVAKMAYQTRTLRGTSKAEPMQSHLLDKHFLRKHGVDAYYGQ